MSFPMAEISGRRPDQLRDLMTVLELGTVNLNNRTRILDQRLRCNLDGAGLTRPRRAEEEKVSNGTAGSCHAGQIHLINADNFPNSFLLSNDSFAQVRLKL